MSPVSAAAFVAIAGALIAYAQTGRSAPKGIWAAAGAVVAGLSHCLGYRSNEGEDRYRRFAAGRSHSTRPAAGRCLGAEFCGGGECPVVDCSGHKVTRAAAHEIEILAGFIVACRLLIAASTYTLPNHRAKPPLARICGAHTRKSAALGQSMYGSLAGWQTGCGVRDTLGIGDRSTR